MYIHPDDLKEELFNAGLVSRRALDSAEERAEDEGRSLDSILLEEELVRPYDVRRIKANLLGIPFVKVKAQEIPEDIFMLFPEPFARKIQAIPIAREGSVLEIAVLDPDMLELVAPFEERLSVRILPRVTDEISMKQALLRYQQILKNSFSFSPKKDEASLPMLFKHAFFSGAKAIHFEEHEGELSIRYRIFGVMTNALKLSGNAAKRLLMEVYEVANLQEEEFGTSVFEMTFEEKQYIVRASSLPLAEGKRIVLSLREGGALLSSLEEFEMSDDLHQEIEQLLFKRRGLALLVGEEREKLLEALLESLKERSVICIGEKLREKLPQKSIAEGIPIKTALKSAARQDPDALLVSDLTKPSLAFAATLSSRTLIIASLSEKDPESALSALKKALPENMLSLIPLHILSAEGNPPKVRGINSL
ncbi:MAG: ATPase, T2SS/T4P/T4SS family [Candidatus Paceibacterota bacterium]